MHITTPPGNRRGGTAPSRRDLLGAAGFTGLCGIAAAAIAKLDKAASPFSLLASRQDAELIVTCHQFIALQERWHQACLRGGVLPAGHADEVLADAEMTRIEELQEPLVQRLLALPTRSVDGFRARARAFHAVAAHG